MNFQKIFVPAACLVLIGAAWRSYGWQGVAVVGGGLVMWLLLHYTRMITILKKAADRPIGFVGSAPDADAAQDWDYSADSLTDLAAQMGC